MKIVLVDKYDKEIGSAEYKTGKLSGIYRVSALWLTNSDHQVLLAQRKYTKISDPGKWGPAASGTIEVGETYESNIYKEASEEIGLTGYKFKKGAKFLNNYGKFVFFVQWYVCEVDWPIHKFRIQDEEVEEIKWFDVNELKKELDKNSNKFIVGAKEVWSNFL